MGRPKQLLPWPKREGGRPLVAVAFDAVSGACDEMVVVLGHEAEAVRTALAPRAYREATGVPDGEMVESVRAGLAAARAIDEAASVLLHPADHPRLAPATLDALVTAHLAHPGRAIIPQAGDRGGHPVLIPPALVADLLRTPLPGGLRQHWLDHPDACIRLPVDDPDVVRDLDDPADYE